MALAPKKLDLPFKVLVIGGPSSLLCATELIIQAFNVCLQFIGIVRSLKLLLSQEVMVYLLL